MPRRHQSNPLPLFVALVAIVLLAVLPLRVTGWVSVFRGPMMTVLAPIAAPLSALSVWLRSDSGGRLAVPNQATLEAANAERDRLARLYLQSLSRIDELEALLEDLQRVTARRSAAVQQLEARRVGINLSAGTVDYDRGAVHGVTSGAVALSRRGEQLVGQITKLGPSVCTAHLITDKRKDAPLMVGVIIPADAQGNERLPEGSDVLASLKRCQLRANGEGTLVDAHFGVGPDGQDTVSVGDYVRLLDESWPSSAQMAVLGRVVAIEPAEQPLFRVLRVAPIADIQRLRSVILLVPLDEKLPSAPASTPTTGQPAGLTGSAGAAEPTGPAGADPSDRVGWADGVSGTEGSAT
jgi:cell shape-determining protein MreC